DRDLTAGGQLAAGLLRQAHDEAVTDLLHVAAECRGHESSRYSREPTPASRFLTGCPDRSRPVLTGTGCRHPMTIPDVGECKSFAEGVTVRRTSWCSLVSAAGSPWAPLRTQGPSVAASPAPRVLPPGTTTPSRSAGARRVCGRRPML